MMKRGAALLMCLVLAGFPAVALAKCPQTTLAQIESQVMCPVCGVPLALATEAPQAQRQRAFILDQIDQCKSEDQVLDALVAEYGPGVLALPDRHRPRGRGLPGADRRGLARHRRC